MLTFSGIMAVEQHDGLDLSLLSSSAQFASFLCKVRKNWQCHKTNNLFFLTSSVTTTDVFSFGKFNKPI